MIMRITSVRIILDIHRFLTFIQLNYLQFSTKHSRTQATSIEITSYI